MNLTRYGFTFDPRKKGLRKILGDLEHDIMELLWTRGAATVRELHRLLAEERDPAYTTVMTVMSRLAEKGLLRKRKEGNAFVYSPTCSREAFTESTLKRVISGLVQDFATPAISHFVDSLDDEEPGKLEELARIIEEKRRKKTDA